MQQNNLSNKNLNAQLNIEKISATHFKLEGIVNFDTIMLLKQQIKSDPTCKDYQFDFQNIYKIDSSLVSFLLECRRNDKNITISFVPKALISLINLYGVKDFFNLEDTHTLLVKRDVV